MLPTWHEDLGEREISWATALCADPSTAIRWRPRFNPPTWDVVERCCRSAEASLMFLHGPESLPVCLFQVHDLDERFWHAQISVLADPAYVGSPTLGQALILGSAVAFARYPLRKVYAEVLVWAPDGDPNLSYLRHCTLEGELRDHYYCGGRWCDVRLYALWRRDLQDLAPASLVRRAEDWVHGSR